MNADTFKGAWHNIKGSAKVQWGKLTDDDVTQIDGHVERLLGILQQRYGYARDRAEREVTMFLDNSSAAREV